MKKNFSRFAAGIAAAVLAGAGILGALLPGCFNPLAAGSPGVEKTPGRSGGLADVWTEPQPFEVAIQIRQASPDSRSIAGPGAMLLAMRGADSIRNFAQLIVMNPETRKILFASQQRRQNNADAGTEFSVPNLSIGRTYAFFLLMGHWERTYEEGPDADYDYEDNLPPTLLAAGLATPYLELKGGIQTVTIAMFPVQVDTKFTPLENTAEPGETPRYAPYAPPRHGTVEPLTVNYQPFPAFLYTAPDAWRFDWTVKGQGAYRALKLAQDMASGTQGNGLNFYSQKTGVTRRKEAAGNTGAATPIDEPETIIPDPPAPNLVTLTWDDTAAGWLAAGTGSSVTAEIGPVTVEKKDGSTATIPYEGWGYFNLEYVPFGNTTAENWDGFTGNVTYPAFYLKDATGSLTNIPRWIIRNGINDRQQDKGTRFSPWKPWNGKNYDATHPDAAVNGNGGVCFVGTSVNVNTISSTVFTYYVKATGYDTNNGLSKDTPFKTVRKALDQLASDYAAWKQTKATVAAILGEDAVKELEAWGDIRVIGMVEEVGNIAVNGNHPTVYLRDDDDTTTGDTTTFLDTLKLSTKDNNLIRVQPNGTLRLAGSLNLVGKIENSVPLVQVEGKLILEDNAVIRDNKNSNPGGDVYVNVNFTMSGSTGTDEDYGGGVYVTGTFEMTGGVIRGNTASNGGGVYVENGSFTMSGGTIGGTDTSAMNTANRGGSGVYITGDTGIFTMSGGTISGNQAGTNTDSGGTVCVAGSATFCMSGGTISGNTVGKVSMVSSNDPYSQGGGVYVTGAGTKFHMSGGKITDNTVNELTSTNSYPQSQGGGVYVADDAEFLMEGGTISGNTLAGSNTTAQADPRSQGGGVYVNGSFTMSGGIISNNMVGGSNYTGDNQSHYSTPRSQGGGVYVAGGTFTMLSGGIISNNTVQGSSSTLAKHKPESQGGGVYVANGAEFSMEGGTIKGNEVEPSNNGGTTIPAQGGGVYVTGSGSFTKALPTGGNTGAVILDNIADVGRQVFWMKTAGEEKKRDDPLGATEALSTSNTDGWETVTP